MTGFLAYIIPVDSSGGGQPPGQPSHPIYNPPYPDQGLPPVTGYPPYPSHPIPPYPGQGPIIPPSGGGGQPPYPSHPIPPYPGQGPIIPPGGGGQPPYPSHPIPPYPDQGLPPGQPGQGGGGGSPSFPIWGPPGTTLPPGTGYPPTAGHPLPEPPTEGAKPIVGWEAKAFWTPSQGWAVAVVPKEGTDHVTPSSSQQSQQPSQPKK